MDMPINIVPAPFGALVGLYISTNDKLTADQFQVNFSEEEGETGRVEFHIKPVVAWGYFVHAGGFSNSPMIVDAYGSMAIAGAEPGSLPEEILNLSDLSHHEFHGVCALAEAEIRVSDVAAMRGLDIQRVANAEFRSADVLDLPTNFRL